MEIGDRAIVTRTFSAADSERLARLAGLSSPLRDHVPEPLIASLFSYLLGVCLPGFGTNYLKQEMEFFEAVPFDTSLTAAVEVTRIRPDRQLVDLATTCVLPSGGVICRGRALVLVKDVGRRTPAPR